MCLHNVGSDDEDCVTTGDLVSLFCKKWNADDKISVRATWENKAEKNAPHEANFLKLDSTKIKVVLGNRPRWHINERMEKTMKFSKAYLATPEKIPEEIDWEIEEFSDVASKIKYDLYDAASVAGRTTDHSDLNTAPE